MTNIVLDAPPRPGGPWIWLALIVTAASSIVSTGLLVWVLMTQPTHADDTYRPAQTCVCKDTPKVKR
mgnify:CR=1 FL=1